ncbi:MAG: phospholipase [Cyclobacteriaceae bacterium]
MEHHITFEFNAPFHTLNELTNDTQYVWLAFHGYAQLSRYFITKFSELDSQQNFIICPQGLSKFYQKGFSGRVGATWMTKDDRLTDIENQKSFLDAIADNYDLQNLLKDKKLIYFGFSQGVSTMCRIAAHLKLPFHKMILWAGSIPPELTTQDFDFQVKKEVSYYSGTNDPFFKEGLDAALLKQAEDLFETKPEVVWFEGVHEVKPALISKILNA